MRYFLFLIYFLLAAQSWAVNEAPEDICPGGATPRADIIKCMHFGDSDNCTTGQEAACLDDNGIAAASYNWGTTDQGFAVRFDGGVVGSGYISGSGPVGGTGPGYQNASLGASLTHVRYRYYFRLGEGWLNYQGHGPSITTTSGGCVIGGGGTGLEIGGNNYFFYMTSTCAGPYSTNIPINQASPPELKNGQWYMAEIEGQIDTSCSDSSSMYGCNGILKVWIDGTLVISYTNINWAGTTQTGRFTDYWGPRFYQHKRTPAWKPKISFDQFAISNDGTLIGAAPGAVAGTGIPESPYLGHWNVEPFLGHNPEDDCSTFSSYLQTKDGYQWRGGATLSTEQKHSGMTDQCPSATPDNSMKVNIAATANGGGLYWDRTDWENNFGGTATFSGYPSYSIHGWIYLPAGNDYTNRPMLAGFYGRSTGEDWGRALGLTVAGGNFAVVEKNKAIAETRVLAYTSSVPATEATWHEFELIAWNTNKVTLSINGVKLADKAALTYDLDYLFTPMAATGILMGVDNFVGTAPFVAYYDDINIGSVSWYSCDGWGADCPWATTFSRSPARRSFRLSGH